MMLPVLVFIWGLHGGAGWALGATGVGVRSVVAVAGVAAFAVLGLTEFDAGETGVGPLV